MTESILLTVKKMMGIAEEYHAFDLDLIININSVFLTLNQLGVGPESPFQITGDSEVWTSFINPTEVPGIQTYVYLKTRLLFDPPTNSFLVDSMQKQISELEWRLNVQVDTEYLEESESLPGQEPSIPESIEPTPTIPVEPKKDEASEIPMFTAMQMSMTPARRPKVSTTESVREAIERIRKSK